MWEFFNAAILDPITFGSVTSLPVYDRPGGVAAIQAGISAQRIEGILFGQNSFVMADENPWYIAGRFGAPIRGTDTAWLAFGGVEQGATGSFALSVYAVCGYTPGSATHWSAQWHDGINTQNLVSTVALDALFHNFEMWFDGTNVFLSVDGETPITAVATAMTVTGLLDAIVHIRDNDGGGQDTYCAIDKFLVMTNLPLDSSPPA